MVRQDAWDSLTPGQRLSMLSLHTEGAALGEPAPMLDPEDEAWLVWDGSIAETTITMFAALMANPELIPETEVDDDADEA